jgi:hypothetical protein
MKRTVVLLMCLMLMAGVGSAEEGKFPVNKELHYVIKVKPKLFRFIPVPRSLTNWNSERTVGEGCFYLEELMRMDADSEDGLYFILHAVADGGATGKYWDEYGIHEHSESFFREEDGELVPMHYTRLARNKEYDTWLEFIYQADSVQVTERLSCADTLVHNHRGSILSEIQVKDVLTCFYYIFSRDHSVGDTLYLASHDRRKPLNIFFKTEGQEEIEAMGEKHLANRLIVRSIGVNVFENVDDVVLWQSQEDHLPLKFTSRVKVGGGLLTIRIEVELVEIKLMTPELGGGFNAGN